MRDKWIWIYCAIGITVIFGSDAVTNIMKAQARSACIASYASSTRSIEDIKKLCE